MIARAPEGRWFEEISGSDWPSGGRPKPLVLFRSPVNAEQEPHPPNKTDVAQAVGNLITGAVVGIVADPTIEVLRDLAA